MNRNKSYSEILCDYIYQLCNAGNIPSTNQGDVLGDIFTVTVHSIDFHHQFDVCIKLNCDADFEYSFTIPAKEILRLARTKKSLFIIDRLSKVVHTLATDHGKHCPLWKQNKLHPQW